MKKFLSIFLILLAFLSYSKAATFAYVEIDKVMNNSEKGKNYKQNLESKLRYYQTKAQELQDKIENIQKQLQSPTLNNKVKEEKRKELRDLARQLQNLEAQANEELAKMKAEAEKKMISEIKGVAAKVAKNKNIDIVFYGGLLSGVLYADKKIDITDEVLKEYNKQK